VGKREQADQPSALILDAAAHAPMAYSSVLNGEELVRNGIEAILAGSNRDVFPQATLALPHQTTMLVDCSDPDELPPKHRLMPMPGGRGQAPPSSACTDAACRPSRSRIDWRKRWQVHVEPQTGRRPQKKAPAKRQGLPSR
jgi:hypothetical protein